MHNSLLDVIEDFNSKSQLTVNESQEAIFYKDAQALDSWDKTVSGITLYAYWW